MMELIIYWAIACFVMMWNKPTKAGGAYIAIYILVGALWPVAIPFAVFAAWEGLD